jgi:hypothetical protein
MSTRYPAAERIGRYPGFIRSTGLLAARNHGRLDALAAVAGNALDVEHGERHKALIVPIMAARVTLKAINDELLRRGLRRRADISTSLAAMPRNASTERCEQLSTLTLDQWIDEFKRLKEVNLEIMGKPRQAKQGKA